MMMKTMMMMMMKKKKKKKKNKKKGAKKGIAQKMSGKNRGPHFYRHFLNKNQAISGHFEILRQKWGSFREGIAIQNYVYIYIYICW